MSSANPPDPCKDVDCGAGLKCAPLGRSYSCLGKKKKRLCALEKKKQTTSRFTETSFIRNRGNPVADCSTVCRSKTCMVPAGPVYTTQVFSVQEFVQTRVN